MTLIILGIFEAFLLFITIFILHFLIFFIHELGHGIGYTLSTGDNEWSITIGTGKNLFKSKRLTLNIFMWRGRFFPKNKRIDTKHKLLATLAGRPIASFIILIIFLSTKEMFFGLDTFISDSAMNFIYAYLFNLNLFILLYSLVPIKSDKYFHNYGTDGYHILNLLRKN